MNGLLPCVVCGVAGCPVGPPAPSVAVSPPSRPVITDRPASLPPPPGALFVVHGDGWRVRPPGSRTVAVGRNRFVTLTNGAATLWDPAIGRVAGVDGRSFSVVVAPACESEHGCEEQALVTPDGAWVLTLGLAPDGDHFARVGIRLDPEPVPDWRESPVVQETTDAGNSFFECLRLRWNDDSLAIVGRCPAHPPPVCDRPGEHVWWGPSAKTVVCRHGDGWVWSWAGGDVITDLPGTPVSVGFSVDGARLAAYDGRRTTVASAVDGLAFEVPGWAAPVGNGDLLVGDAWFDGRDGTVLLPTAPSASVWTFHPDGTVWPGGPPCVGRRGPVPCPPPSPNDVAFEVPVSGQLPGTSWSLDARPDGSIAVLAAP